MGDVLGSEWRDLEQARLRLARLRVDEGDIERVYRKAVTISSAVLGVGRVGVWLLDRDTAKLTCVCLRDEEQPALETAMPSLRIKDLGAYEAALADRRVIAAEDVDGDPRTRDLSGYFAPLGIRATLDVPFYRDGRVAGVVCHEHRGAPRAWTDRDIGFASTVADVVGSLTISRELAQALDGLRVREVALEQALRGEAVARIARVVGHDIQSLLTAISLTSELIARRGDSEEVRLKAAQTIFEATEAAMRLSRQLLTVAGRPETSGGPRVLDDAIQRFLPALRGLAGADRLLEIELGQPGAVVPMDRTQIEQVLLNLVVNARDATSAGGRILVRTRASARSEPRSLTLEVEDDGAGMDEATRARIFDPYFSTKDRGTNSGLGLASVRGIVASAGGEVSVRSAPGEGATFSCRVPIMEARPITAS